MICTKSYRLNSIENEKLITSANGCNRNSSFENQSLLLYRLANTWQFVHAILHHLLSISPLDCKLPEGKVSGSRLYAQHLESDISRCPINKSWMNDFKAGIHLTNIKLVSTTSLRTLTPQAMLKTPQSSFLYLDLSGLSQCPGVV